MVIYTSYVTHTLYTYKCLYPWDLLQCWNMYYVNMYKSHNNIMRCLTGDTSVCPQVKYYTKIFVKSEKNTHNCMTIYTSFVTHTLYTYNCLYYWNILQCWNMYSVNTYKSYNNIMRCLTGHTSVCLEVKEDIWPNIDKLDQTICKIRKKLMQLYGYLHILRYTYIVYIQMFIPLGFTSMLEHVLCQHVQIPQQHNEMSYWGHVCVSASKILCQNICKIRKIIQTIV